MYLNKIILFFCFALSVSCLNAQELGLHFMNNVFQSAETNPGMLSRNKVNIALPSPYFNYYNSSFALSDFAQTNNGVLDIDMVDLMNTLDDQNRLRADFDVHTLAVAVRLSKFQISASHTIRNNFSLDVPKSLFSLVNQGNAAYVGETVNIAPTVNVLSYSEIALGGAMELKKDLVVGAKVKYLSGLGAITTNRNNISLFTDPEFYQLTATTDYQISSGGVPLEIDENDFEFNSFDDVKFFGKNSGVAFDLGATYEWKDKFFFSASILDIGSISWKDELKNYSSQGTFTFEGIEVDQLINGDSLYMETFADSLGTELQNRFEFVETEKAFKTSLPTKFYLSGTMTPVKGLHLGGLIYGEHYQGKFYPSVMLNVEKEFKRIFSIGANYSMRNKTFDNVGLNCSLKLAGMQLYLIADNVLPFLNPLNTKAVNFRTGFNIAIK